MFQGVGVGGTVTILGPRCQRIDFSALNRYIIRMTIRPLRVVLLFLAAVGIAIAGYTAYWYSAAEKLREEVTRWSEERRAAGWQVDLGVLNISGFPSRIEIFLQTPRLEGPKRQWRWTAPNVRAFAAPWSLGKVSVFAPGIHVYTNRKGDFWAELGSAEAQIAIAPSGLDQAVIRFSSVDIRPPDGARLQAETAIARIQSGVAIDAAVQPPEFGWGIAVDARGVTLPGRWNPPLGRKMARLSLDAVLTGRIERGPTLANTLARWRDSGGVIEVKALAVDWQALALRAEGTFALDEGLQPEGAMTADIRGIDRTTDQLIAAGVIDARTAFAAKVANRALSFRGGSAKLPLSIQKQRLYMGPVPLLRLKLVRWD